MAENNKNIHGVDEMIEKLTALKEYLQDDVYTVIGVEAQKHFRQNFEEEGFVDKSVEKWASRKTKRTGSTNGQKVMTKSSDLAESIDYEVRKPDVIIKTDKEYAQIHNEGGEITVTPKMRRYFWALHKQFKEAGDEDMADQYKGMALAKKLTMPQRKFIGESQTMNDNIIAKILRDLNRIVN